MAGTRDLINELITQIDTQGFDYVIGIIKPKSEKTSVKDIDIYTNLQDNGLEKLLFILEEHSKGKKPKTNNSK